MLTVKQVFLCILSVAMWVLPPWSLDSCAQQAGGLVSPASAGGVIWTAAPTGTFILTKNTHEVSIGVSFLGLYHHKMTRME